MDDVYDAIELDMMLAIWYIYQIFLFPSPDLIFSSPPMCHLRLVVECITNQPEKFAHAHNLDRIKANISPRHKTYR